MGEKRGKGLWIGLFGLALVAIVFLVLWFVRSGDVDRLTADLGSSKSSVQRLNHELQEVRSQVDSSNRRVADLENQVREETRRAAEAANQLERRLRSDLDFSAQSLATANIELERLRERGEAATAETTKLRNELDNARLDLAHTRDAGGKELKRITQELASANGTIKELENRLKAGNASIQSLEEALHSTQLNIPKDGTDPATIPETELAMVKAELAKTAIALSEARNANAILEEMRSKLAAEIEKDQNAAVLREQELMRTIQELSARIESGSAAMAISAAVPDQQAREIADLRQQVTRFQKNAEELEAAGEKAAADLAGATASATEWKIRAETMEKELAEWKSRASAEAAAVGERLAARLDTVEKEFAAFRDRTAAETKTADEGWRNRLTKAEKDLDDLRAESAAKAKTLEADLKSRVDAAEKDLSDFKARAAATEKDLQNKLAAKDGELAQTEKRVAAELASLKRDHATNVRKLEGDFQSRLEAVRKDAADQLAASEKSASEKFAAAEKAAAERLSASERASTAKRDELQKELETRMAKIAELEESEKESARKIVLLKNAFTRQGEILKETAAKFEQEKKELRANIADLEQSLAEISPGGSGFAPFPIGRSVGKIVDRLSDGQIMLIDGGVNQRMKPGMKFDAFRPVGEGNRYTGMIKIIRVLDNYSMAVSSYAEVNGLVCPITGRAVLEPDAKYSPYAVGKDNRPVELVPADKIAVPLEAPAIGDSINNPFYHPDRQMRFAISPELAGDPCITAAIEALNGTPRTGSLAKDADFIVVRNMDSEPDADATGPRRVTIGHLARYLDPAPAR